VEQNFSGSSKQSWEFTPLQAVTSSSNFTSGSKTTFIPSPLPAKNLLLASTFHGQGTHLVDYLGLSGEILVLSRAILPPFSSSPFPLKLGTPRKDGDIHESGVGQTM
jgi:hypothetical protein